VGRSRRDASHQLLVPANWNGTVTAMKSNMDSKSIRSCLLVRSAVIGLSVAVISFGAASVALAQQTFKSPEEASETLAAALRAGDQKALVDVLGPGSLDVITSGDDVDDQNLRKAFLAAYDLRHSVKTEGDKPATLLIGQDDYPFSIPIAKKDGKWSFDIAGGREELLARRIGRNELAAIQVCLAFFDAQNEYAAMTKVNNLSVYAQRVVSTPGTKNGLYWPTAPGEAKSPLGEEVALATLRGVRVGSGEPYHGYFYKILTRQGPKAPGGEHDYVVDGKMIGGFALVAWPATYGNSGITTFMTSYDGEVYQKDLGPDTSKAAQKITAFNPDDSWKKVSNEQ
jgi:hypothetical protein